MVLSLPAPFSLAFYFLYSHALSHAYFTVPFCTFRHARLWPLFQPFQYQHTSLFLYLPGI